MCLQKGYRLQAHILQFTHHFTIFYQKKKQTLSSSSPALEKQSRY